MYNHEWPRYIQASIAKHFNSNKGDSYMYLPGHAKDNRDQNSEWFELRVIGPTVRERNRGSYIADVEIDILVQVNTYDNIYAFSILGGEIASWFTCINVEDDDGVLVGTLQLVTEGLAGGVDIIPYAISKDHPHQTGLVVGSYEMWIST